MRESIRGLLKWVVVVVVCRGRSLASITLSSLLHYSSALHHTSEGIWQGRSRGVSRYLRSCSIKLEWCRVLGRHVIDDIDGNSGVLGAIVNRILIVLISVRTLITN
jgi:hypothetical protein